MAEAFILPVALKIGDSLIAIALNYIFPERVKHASFDIRVTVESQNVKQKFRFRFEKNAQGFSIHKDEENTSVHMFRKHDTVNVPRGFQPNDCTDVKHAIAYLACAIRSDYFGRVALRRNDGVLEIFVKESPEVTESVVKVKYFKNQKSVMEQGVILSDEQRQQVLIPYHYVPSSEQSASSHGRQQAVIPYHYVDSSPQQLPGNPPIYNGQMPRQPPAANAQVNHIHVRNYNVTINGYMNTITGSDRIDR